MKHFEISKLSNDSIVSKFATKKWIEVNKLSGNQYSVIKIQGSNSELWGYSNAYILIKGAIELLATAANENDEAEKNLKIMHHLGRTYQKLLKH